MSTRKTASRPAAGDSQSLDFEARLEQLEKLVSRMESGEMSLEESLKAFEEGVKLTRQCQETLAAAQQKVQVLMQQQGKISLEASSLQVLGDEDEEGNED